MTRKELEQKKGVKLAQRDASPAETLLTVKPEKKEEKKASTLKDKNDEIEKPEKEAASVDGKKENKITHYSIRITSEMADDIDLAKFVYGDFAKYVRTLIKKDMEKNRKEYVEIRDKRRSMF